MVTVWATFLLTGVGLLALAVIAFRWKGENAPVLRTVGRFLLLLAVVTALFPSVLASLGPTRWAAAYVAFVLVITAVMTTTAVVRARTLRS